MYSASFNTVHKINRIHERTLRIAHKDYQSTFNVLQENNCTVNMHVKNLQTHVTEMTKARKSLNCPFIKEIFCEQSVVHNLRNNNEFLPPMVRAVSYGTETIKYIEQRLLVKLPQYIWNTQSINEFKTGS